LNILVTKEKQVMKRQLSILAAALLVLLIAVTVVVAARQPLPPQAQVSISAEQSPIAIGAMRQVGAHLRPPSKDVLMAELQKDGLPLNATQEQIQAAQAAYLQRFTKQSATWINPKFQEWAIQHEAELASRTEGTQAVVPVSAAVFAMAVDFGATETYAIPVAQEDGSCVTETHTIAGPLHGQIPRPPATDNFTLWYSPSLTSDTKFYESLIFGYDGPERARYDLTDPDDGQPGINLEKRTVQEYYDNVAGEGNVTIDGTVEGWVTVPHSEARYGADICRTGSPYSGIPGVPVAQLVVDALDVYMAAHPTYWTDPSFWPQYDANHDGILDTFWVIYAGVGQEAGGGELGIWALWSHSSDLRSYAQWPNGYKVYEGNPGTTADDIYVGPYTMQPENSDVGVMAEEFGHNFFGLPDLYTNDYENSVADWAIMAGGSWMGWLGGTSPATMPLWFKMIAAFDTGGTITPVNWQEPMVTRWYTDTASIVTIGQLEKTPVGVNKGVRVNLPAYTEFVDNLTGTGKGAYSGTGLNDADLRLEKQIAIGGSAGGILTFDTTYDIEEDWDYGYVLANGTSIADMGEVTTNYDPNGNNLGNGITGSGSGTLRFDLSAYAGQTITLTLRYKTDAAVTMAGWWVDNVKLDGTLLDGFEGATAPGTFPGWSNSDPGWKVVPTSATHNRYYLVEWRSNTKFDKMLKTAYIHKYSDAEHGDVVDRVPYNIPAAVVYYRDTKYGATYSIAGNSEDPPSDGPKYQLLVVDTSWQPMRIGDTPTTYEGYWTGRLSSYDAGLALQPTQDITIDGYWGLPGEGPWHYPSKPGITSFNDRQGYYAGYYFGDPCPAGYVCYADHYGSAVIPAQDPYSVRITDFHGNPITDFYGIEWPPSWLGSGNPGDDDVQFGVNFDLIGKAGDDAYNSTATLQFYDVYAGTTIQDKVDFPWYYVNYETLVHNTDTKDAHGPINLIYMLDPKLSLVSVTKIDSAGTESEVPAETAGTIVNLILGPLQPGEKFTLVVQAKMPASSSPRVFTDDKMPARLGALATKSMLTVVDDAYPRQYNLLTERYLVSMPRILYNSMP
jgi:immune inhibitor A